MERTGIHHFFDFVMTSETAGALKSDLKPFQLTLDALDVNPANVLHVGDSITQDGACRQLGIAFVYCTWYQKEHPDEPLAPVSPDQYNFRVSNHQELIELISTLSE
jgi:putative hydrolase of the HAD superfamily